MIGIISRSSIRRAVVPIPTFATSRSNQRDNLLNADRARFYYWNLVSIGLTALPIAYMMTINYKVCPESSKIRAVLDPHKDTHLASVDKRLFIDPPKETRKP